MADATAVHATFVLERTYPVAPERVYAAWADPASKARWFSCHGEYHMDFRVGGSEMSRGGEPGGPVYTTHIRFQDIVPLRRIVYTYEVLRDDQRMSVSIATVEFAAEEGGTRMTFTDQGVYLDGLDTPEPREFGTRTGLDRLDAELRGELAGV